MNLLFAMEDIKVRADAWANQTTAQPIGVALLVVTMLAVLSVPRRWALIPFFLLACLAARQRIVLAGMDFDFIRILIIVGWLRVMMRGEMRGIRWNSIDMYFALWWAVGSLAFIALYQTSTAFTLQLGQALSVLGGYFLFRILIRQWSDLRAFVRFAAMAAAPIAVLFLIEKTTARNLFASFGGIPEYTQIREGRVRAQGAFAHPILAGCFWASMSPLFFSLWWGKFLDRALAVVGSLSAVFIVYACASSTPIIAMLAAVGSFGLWLARFHMRTIRRAIVAVLIAVEIGSSNHVWHLFVYANLLGGSTGWHRYHLIDAAIRRFPEWMLIGTKSTAHWGYGLDDVTNQFVLEGVRGGALALILFITLLTACFSAVGRAWRANSAHVPSMVFAWALGSALFVHLTNFFGVSYFGQITTLLYIHIAAIAGLAPSPHRKTLALPAPMSRAPFSPPKGFAIEAVQGSGRDRKFVRAHDV